MGMIRLGCSGWDYRDWADVFYKSMDESRLQAYSRIFNTAEIIESGGNKIVADVKGYSVYIDLEKRFILHDCGDWKRTIWERKFCKHIGALVLALPEDTARMVLESIRGQQWEFSQYTRGESLIHTVESGQVRSGGILKIE